MQKEVKVKRGKSLLYLPVLSFSQSIQKETIMADIKLLQESRAIIREMGVTKKENFLLCPILRVLQMRHHDLNTKQATRVIREVLND